MAIVGSSYSHHPIDIPSNISGNEKKTTATIRILHSAIHSLRHTKGSAKAHRITKTKSKEIKESEVKLNAILSENIEVHHINVELINFNLDKMKSLSISIKKGIGDDSTCAEYDEAKKQCTNCFYKIVVSDGEAISDLNLLKDSDFHNKEINNAISRLMTHFTAIVSLYARVLKMGLK